MILEKSYLAERRRRFVDDAQRGSAYPNEDLEDRVATIKREVDALQVHVMEKAKPWYRQIPVLVSLIVSIGALSFSFWTNYKAEDRLDREEEHATRVELRELIQRLQALPKENFDLFRTYNDDPSGQSALSALLNTENLVLTSQAAELIEELDGDVTATEYYATAQGFYLSDRPAEATKLVEAGLRVAKDPVNEVALLRQDATIRFASGDPEGGRSRWQQAVDVFAKYPDEPQLLVAVTQTYTEIGWAEAELGQGECGAALEHITAAGGHLSGLPATHPLIAQKNYAETAIWDQCGAPPGT
jgi:hypothetical protein